MASTEDVKKLRDATGISVMQCKQALEEAGGDYDKALQILQEKGAAIAAKKADRDLGAGAVSAYIHSNRAAGSMVLLLSETDFVSNNEEFVALAYDIAMHITAANPAYLKRDDIPEERLAEINAMFDEEVADKPDDLKEKIRQGKVDAYLKGIVLMEQEFIKDPEKTIRDLIDSATQKFGERIEVGEFTRYSTR
ncbi:MAG: elongation factor Ts [Patescibacteria group bacterium UBA2163]